MARIIKINNCKECPFVGHSGAFTPGGPKVVCHHRDSVRAVKEYSKISHDQACDWRSRQIIDRIPSWCPLPEST